MSDPRYMEIYTALLAAYGPQHWWPGETPTEVAIGRGAHAEHRMDQR
jgi:endonuclease-3 related protein